MEMRMALGAAIAAAREAGALIRAEFHRAGGPRGEGGRARIDAEVERVLRERLSNAFPDWPIACDDERVPDGTGPCWLVAPHAGSADFLEGFRGSAISIAAVHDGAPVLGAIFAPLAPDDGGDLLAWAEGTPLLRNGNPHDREALPESLGRRHVVLLSPRADDAPDANAACVAPARFRGVPGLAYRLALVAAGDGDAAASLGGGTLAEAAGGHALLRAIGGDLFDEAGRKVRHHAGAGRAARLFAGTEAAARALAARPWDSVFRLRATREPLVARFPRVRLQRGLAVLDAGALARAQGCLLGQLAGDALGALVEFRDEEAIARAYPDGVRDLVDGGTWNTLAGQPTDDSELALLLARTLVRDGGFAPPAILESYRAWLDSRPFDVGGTMGRGLRGARDPQSQANGALMRISPLGVFAHAARPERIAELARADAALTHPHPVCRDASAAFCVAIARAIHDGDGPEAAWDAARAWCREANAEASVVEALDAAAHAPPEDFLEKAGWVRVALQNAFYQLLHARSAEAGVIDTVRRGGDTDTNAAIAGALLGAVHGRDALPLRWRRLVLSCRALDPRYQVRPRPFWPVDAPELAERLLLAGGAMAA